MDWTPGRAARLAPGSSAHLADSNAGSPRSRPGLHAGGAADGSSTKVRARRPAEGGAPAPGPRSILASRLLGPRFIGHPTPGSSPCPSPLAPPCCCSWRRHSRPRMPWPARPRPSLPPTSSAGRLGARLRCVRRTGDAIGRLRLRRRLRGERKLKALGIRPMGDNGSYFQHYPLVRNTLDTARTMAMFGSSTYGWGSDFLVTSFVPRATAGTGGVAYVGHGIRSAKLGLDPYAGVDIGGSGWWRTDGADVASLPRPRHDRRGLHHGARGSPQSRRARHHHGADHGVAQWLGGDPPRAPMGRDLRETVGRAYAPYPLPQLLASRSMIVRRGSTLDGAPSGAPIRRASSRRVAGARSGSLRARAVQH